MMSPFNIYQCKYCSITFATEDGYDKHVCRYMERYVYVKTTPTGISAYNYYLTWLRLKGRSVRYIDEHTFIHSTQYNHFINFINMCNERGVPTKESYIRVMMDIGILPQFWTRDEVYSAFLEEYDVHIDPVKQIDISHSTILQLSEAMECETSEFFDNIDVDIFFTLLKTRKISPWLLLLSNKFRIFLFGRATSTERSYVQKYINPKKWEKIFTEHSNVTELAAETVAVLGI